MVRPPWRSQTARIQQGGVPGIAEQALEKLARQTAEAESILDKRIVGKSLTGWEKGEHLLLRKGSCARWGNVAGHGSADLEK